MLLDYSRPGLVRLQVEDDGTGFPPPSTAATPVGGVGPVGVRERVGRLGRTVELASRPGAGVTMTLELPG